MIAFKIGEEEPFKSRQVGLLTHGFDLSSILIGLLLPAIKEIFTMVAGPLYIVWFVLIGIRLFQLSKKID